MSAGNWSSSYNQLLIKIKPLKNRITTQNNDYNGSYIVDDLDFTKTYCTSNNQNQKRGEKKKKKGQKENVKGTLLKTKHVVYTK